MNLLIISTAEPVTVNSIAVQYVRRTDPSSLISRTLNRRTAFSSLIHFSFATPSAELTIVILVTSLSVRRTDRSTEQ